MDKTASARWWFGSVRSSWLGLLLAVGALMQAQAPHRLTAADETRVAAIVAKMTMPEKLAYIGGTGFAVRAMPELKLPSLEMSDGPYGVRSNSGAPSTTYAAGIGLAATWTGRWRKRLARGLAAMRGHVA